MKIAFACDHAGIQHKEKILEFLKSKNHEVIDCGCFSEVSCDYADTGGKAAGLVSRGTCERGVLTCGSGTGMCIVANKFPGIRAALAFSDEIVKLSREHNDSNIICIPGRFFDTGTVLRWLNLWLDTNFSNDERHIRRINKIKEIEKQTCS